ncbi:MAG: dihydroxyacetone kinase family protein [Mycetocola sp.]
MTRLFNDPADFPQELLDGFTIAYPRYVRAVRGGVVRSTVHSEVAVIAGGGSGHYPAFHGLVGQGLAHAAVVGNLFSSPSAKQAFDVAVAAERGQGVVFSYGNYAGDVMHFGEAVERLTAQGITATSVVVTDDIASAPPEDISRRRGIAGDLVVFKVMGAAAAEGADFDEVVRLGRHANDRTRTLGVAFAGCTLPGASEPLFTVPEGMMSIGLGIHGEPGISEVPVPTADGLAEILVERLLAEAPAGAGTRVTALMNGLGTVAPEELFVVLRRAAALLAEAGLELVEPDVGELCTSLDMAGASLTLVWLDDELERLWCAPADTPAYRRGSVAPAEQEQLTEAAGLADGSAVVQGSAESQRVAARVAQGINVLTETLIAHAEELGQIDAVAGDGDHGIGMERGSRAARGAAETARGAGAGASTLLAAAGDAWSDQAGGTSGMLWGIALTELGQQLGDELECSAERVAAGVSAARDGIMRVGKAVPGDKTLVDALVPFADTLTERVAAGEALAVAWRGAAEVAVAAAAATADLRPRLGRARPLAEKSIGTVDAGAYSFGLIVTALADFLSAE